MLSRWQNCKRWMLWRSSCDMNIQTQGGTPETDVALWSARPPCACD